MSLRSVVPALRCPCAPLSLRSVVPALLLVSLALLTAPAKAGQWAVTYSGSTTGTGPAYATYNFANNQVTGPPPFSTVPPNNVPPNNLTLGSGCTLSATAPGTATLNVTATLTWTPSYAGDPSVPPSSVGVIETSSASASIYWVNPTGVKQTADDGFKDSPTLQTAPLYGASSSGSHFTSVPVPAGSTSVTLPQQRTVTATLTCASSQGGNGSGGITLTYSVAPVFLTLTGPVPNSGSLHILVGQQCTAQLSALPNGFTVNNLQWTATGNTVQSSSWNVASGDTSATFSGLVNPYTFTQATPQATGPSWYWDDSTTSQTVTCTATVTPPSGQGAAFPITATQKVTLDQPTFKNTDPTGAVELDAKYQAQSGVNLHAGADGDNVPGILFNDTVTTPNVSLYGSTGYWYRVQLVAINRTEYALNTNVASVAPGNSVASALDFTTLSNGGTSIVYNNQIIQADGSTYDPNHNTMAENDSPGLPVLDKYQEYKVANEKYTDYIMYHAPGTSIDVPLASYTWSWNADVHIPQTPLPKSWSHYGSTSTGGTITPPGTVTSLPTYPTWTALNQPNLP